MRDISWRYLLAGVNLGFHRSLLTWCNPSLRAWPGQQLLSAHSDLWLPSNTMRTPRQKFDKRYCTALNSACSLSLGPCLIWRPLCPCVLAYLASAFCMLCKSTLAVTADVYVMSCTTSHDYLVWPIGLLHQLLGFQHVSLPHEEVVTVTSGHHAVHR